MAIEKAPSLPNRISLFQSKLAIAHYAQGSITDYCRYLHSLSAKGEKATVEELTDLSTMAKNAFPQFFAAITKEEYGLTDREIIFCLLIRFHFIPSEIAVLNGISSQRATNIKTAVNKKMFGANGAKTLEAQLLSLTDI